MFIYIYLKIVFTLTNGADPDEMLQNDAFHLGLSTPLRIFSLHVQRVNWVCNE